MFSCNRNPRVRFLEKSELKMIIFQNYLDKFKLDQTNLLIITLYENYAYSPVKCKSICKEFHTNRRSMASESCVRCVKKAFF